VGRHVTTKSLYHKRSYKHVTGQSFFTDRKKVCVLIHTERCLRIEKIRKKDIGGRKKQNKEKKVKKRIHIDDYM